MINFLKDKLSRKYQCISQSEAKHIMEERDDIIIVDVRTEEEYREYHIEGAILIPNESISKQRPKQLSDLEQTILVYCRSGHRSKLAARKLAALGYTNIYEFGGIITWEYGVVN